MAGLVQACPGCPRGQLRLSPPERRSLCRSRSCCSPCFWLRRQAREPKSRKSGAISWWRSRLHNPRLFPKPFSWTRRPGRLGFCTTKRDSRLNGCPFGFRQERTGLRRRCRHRLTLWESRVKSLTRHLTTLGARRRADPERTSRSVRRRRGAAAFDFAQGQGQRHGGERKQHQHPEDVHVGEEG